MKELDPLLHSQLRLAVMSLLIQVKEAEFAYLKSKTNASSGNLSVQLQKLKEAGYIHIEKKFHKNYPQTICKVTGAGRDAFERYVTAIKEYILPNNKS